MLLTCVARDDSLQIIMIVHIRGFEGRRQLCALLARFFGAAKGEGYGGDFFIFVDGGFEAANG